jgi:rhodanese-related sulfurtransferase
MEHLSEYLHNHPWISALAVLMIVVVAVYEFRARGLSYSAVSPQEAIRLMNGGAAVFDVRDEAAFAAGHIAQAKPLTEAQIAAADEHLKKYRQKNVIVYCDQGVRAGAVVRRLHAQGFTQVFNLQGGLAAWRAEQLPLKKA